MEKFQLILLIEGIVKGNYQAWTIGVTDKPEDKKKERGNTRDWYVWEANSEEIACDMEEFFIQKGCKRVVGKHCSGTYIFIYL